MNIKKLAVILITLLLLLFLFIICIYKERSIVSTPTEYIFLTAWGSKGTGDGQFGSPIYGYKITDETIEKLKNRFDKAKLKTLESFKNREVNGPPEMGEIFLKLDFTNDEIFMILREAEPLDKPDAKYTNGPVYITVDTSGNIYVSDSRNDRIQKFDSDGNFITKWGSKGVRIRKDDPDGVFNRPEGIAVDREGNIYVADSSNSRVQKFTVNGKFLTKWSVKGKSGKDLSPGGIAIDDKQNIYVMVLEDLIQVFDSNGTFISRWNGPDFPVIRIGSIIIPLTASLPEITKNIAVDENEYLYITSRERTPDFGPGVLKYNSSGKCVAKWGREGSEDGQFQYISGIAADFKGCVFVADKGNNRIQKFTTDGKFVCTWGSKGSGDGEFLYPENVAIDSDGNVYVMDSGNGRIQKFAPVPESIKEF